MGQKEFLEELEQSLSSFEDESEASHESAHASLAKMREAMAYPLNSGGKRVRPVLCNLTAQAVGGSPASDNARLASRAIELVHTYSLVHDDMPCMDNDGLRRGRPTVHAVYGDAAAVLVGDGLLTEAFVILSRLQPHENTALVSQAVETLGRLSGYRGMVGGQWLDLALERKNATMEPPSSFTFDTLVTLQSLKTGCLLGAATELGVLCGLNEREVSGQSVAVYRQMAREAGVLLGVAFQLVDDVLDQTATSSALGKTAGKDVAAGKKTAASLLGVDQATQIAGSYTREAQSRFARLFEKITAQDETSESARIELCSFLEALLTRKA